MCEVQLHLADIVAHKESTHVLYEYFRTYFAGRAEASRMEALQQIREFGGDVDHMISATLQGSDMEQLEHLANLIEELMGDVKVALSIRKRMLELDEGSVEVQTKYGLALKRAGKLSEAELLLSTTLCFSRSQLSDPMNLNTLSLMGNLASVLQAQGKLAEAEPLCREALDGKRQLLGNSHPTTLTSINNLASLLQKRKASCLRLSPCCERHLMERSSCLATPTVAL